jgi:hypothetical protein
LILASQFKTNYEIRGREMNQAFNCEALFNRGEELAAGVAALGDMLQWAPNEVQQGTLVALGGILCRMGQDIIELRKEYLDKNFHDILELEKTVAASAATAQSKKSALIDLASPEGQAQVQALAAAFVVKEEAKSS